MCKVLAIFSSVNITLRPCFSIKLTDIQGVEEQRLFKLNLYPFIISAKSEHLQVHCEDRVSHDQWRGEGGIVILRETFSFDLMRSEEE